jgi:hypothetical protein
VSYLDYPRLHFAGTFRASPPTANNETTNFRRVAEGRAVPSPDDDGANWNPGGDGSWRLFRCQVTEAWLAAGEPAAANDVVRRCLIADGDESAPARIVDLDPEQQLASQIWGLEVRFVDPGGGDGTPPRTLARGDFEPAGFVDAWQRSTGRSTSDAGLGAAYQSVLTGLTWAEGERSAFLGRLRESVEGAGMLSIKFNVDRYGMDPYDPGFLQGRIVGTIGPAAASEPRHFVRGRHLMAAERGDRDFFVPVHRLNFTTAVVTDEALELDLGNTLPTGHGGAIADVGDLEVVYLSRGRSHRIGTVPAATYTAPDWYAETAGIVRLGLTDANRGPARRHPLAIDRAGRHAVAEAPLGLHVRPDGLVHRLDPDGVLRVPVHVTRWGRGAAGARLICIRDSLQLQFGERQMAREWPLEFPAQLIADRTGRATLTLAAAGRPLPRRNGIDGHVFGVRVLAEETLAWGARELLNPCEFVSVRLWDEFAPDEPPTWTGCIREILAPYAALFPAMARFVDLTSFDSVIEHREMLLLAFTRDMRDPAYMPVTRDLSAAKRAALQRWLANPQYGHAAGDAAPAAVAAPRRPVSRGGKVHARAGQIVWSEEWAARLIAELEGHDAELEGHE